MSNEEYGASVQPVRRRMTTEERAEKPELKLLARINMAIVTPALLIGICGLSAFIWKGMEDDRKESKENARSLERSISGVSREMVDLRGVLDGIVRYQIPGTIQLFDSRYNALSGTIDSRYNAQANRIDEISRVNERQDKDIQELRTKFGGSR